MKLILPSPFIIVIFLKFVFGSNEDKKIARTVEENEDAEVEDDEACKEITESELLRIAAEDHIQDPLNSFYDPFEPYRIISYAYWRPITNPALHKNPQIPPNFIPPNAPPQSLPSDFFFQDSVARKLVLEEHAAAFCPFLRRWRESNPLKPYPIEKEFTKNHPPIKFTPGKGYEIDTELDWLNILSRRATDDLARKFILNSVAARTAIAKAAEAQTPAAAPEAVPVKDSQNSKKTDIKKDNIKTQPAVNKKKSKTRTELDVLLSKIEDVKRRRLDCRKLENFMDIPPPMGMFIYSPPNCLQEVVFLMEEHEDRNNPIGRESKSPEIVDKVEHFRQVLIKLNAISESKGSAFDRMLRKHGGKCPFGFKSHKNTKNNKSKQVPKSKEKDKETVKLSNAGAIKVYQGTVPKFAELEEGETVFPSDSDTEFENVTKYVFPYKLVPFPSIQNTLKKYVSI